METLVAPAVRAAATPAVADATSRPWHALNTAKSTTLTGWARRAASLHERMRTMA